MKKRVNLSDIAKELGVSKMAVSLALREDKSISKETIEKVKEVAKRLGYTPNRLAQGLAKGRSSNIAVIVGGSFYDNYHEEFIRGALPYAIDRGYTLSIGITEREKMSESRLIEKYRHMMIDGFLVFHSLDDKPYRQLTKMGVPYVLYTKYFEQWSCDYVVGDDFRGGYEMTSHLLGLGHRKVAYLFDEGLERSSEIANRRKGYHQAMADAGLSPEEHRIIPFATDFDPSGLSARNGRFLELFRHSDRPTALFVCNDLTAACVYLLLRQLGLQIPRDVSVGGYEGVFIGQVLDPQLTTVQTPIREMGRRACQILIDKIEGAALPTEVTNVKLMPELQVRGSTQAPELR
jgi:LacI family transcriptional regulator